MEKNRPLFIVSNLVVILGISILVLSGLSFIAFNTSTGFFEGTISGFSTADLNETNSNETEQFFESNNFSVNSSELNLSMFEQGEAVVGQEVEWINPDTNEIITTAAPEVSETEELEVDGRIQKRVTVASDFDYQNVLTYASIPDLLPEQVKVYWMINGVKTDVTDNIDFNVTFYDENNDGLIDKIFWITPHLSIQEFILEFDITVINPWEFGQSGGDWVIYFDTTGTGTLNLTKDYLSNAVLIFNYLKCGSEDVSYNYIEPSYVVENYTCTETATISHTIGDMPDEIFSMRFDFGNDLQNDVDFAYDPMNCLPWDPGLGGPNCVEACGGPEAFLGFDIAPPVDGACYSDPECNNACGESSNNAPEWSQAINNSGAIEDSGTSSPDTDLTATGNGRCQDADGDSLSFSITSENTSQVDCTIDRNQLNFAPASNWYGNGSSCEITCGDGTDTAAYTVSLNITGVNDAPTTPSGSSLSPSVLNVSNILTTTGAGSTDTEGDTITYYYEFNKSASTEQLQAYSTSNTYRAKPGDYQTTINVYIKAHDGAEYSSGAETETKDISSCYAGDGYFNVTTNDTTCIDEKLSIEEGVNVTSATLKFVRGELNTSFLNISSGGLLNITGGNLTVNSSALGRMIGQLLAENGSVLNYNASQNITFNSGTSNFNLSNATLYNVTINGTTLVNATAINVSLHPIFSLHPADSGFKNLSLYLNISNTTSDGYLKFNISYLDSLVSSRSIKESDIRLWRYDYTASSWSTYTSESNVRVAGNFLSGNVSNFVDGGSTTSAEYTLFTVGGPEKSIAIALSTNLSSNLGWTVSNTIGLEWKAHNNNGTGVTGYYINISANHTPINLTIKVDTALTSGLNTIPLTNFNYSYNNSDSTVPGFNKSITTTASGIGNELVNNSATWLKFFLTVPTRQSAGNYTNTVTIAATAS